MSDLALKRIDELSAVKYRMDGHLCASIRAIDDLTRMLEAVRYTAGLGKHQWERVERARKVAAEADQFLASLSKAEAPHA